MPYAHQALFWLQLVQVLLLALHDWIPLGRLNDIEAVRAENPGVTLFRTTAWSTLPFAFGVAASAYFLHRHWPDWLLVWLRVSYAILLLGELRAWWFPLSGRGGARSDPAI